MTKADDSEMKEKTRENRLRRLASRKGYHVEKLRETSRMWGSYRPYVVYLNNTLANDCANLNDLEEYLNGLKPR